MKILYVIFLASLSMFASAESHQFLELEKKLAFYLCIKH